MKRTRSGLSTTSGPAGAAAQPAVPVPRGPVGIEFHADEFLASYRESLGITEDSMVLGIDEAGRGPAIGDMVYVGGAISLRHHDDLLRAGVADSKTLSDRARETIAAKLANIPTLQFFERRVTATHIGEAMSGRTGQSLNTISHASAISIIQEATLACRGRLCAVYIDTVGPPSRYAAVLRGRFPHLKITVTSKADAKFPIVSAASVIAKNNRELHVDALHKAGYEVGSGYPGDERCVRWYRTHLHRFFGYTAEDAPHVRQTWAPVVAAIEEGCEEVEFEQQLRSAQDDPRNPAANADPRQPKMSFAKPLPRRDPFFTFMLGIRPSTGIL